MAKIDITRTELVWPGKYNEDGTRKEVPRISLPFQVIETVNESRATREAQKATSLGLFDVYEGKEGDTFDAGWRNKLIWGDNLLVMGSLLEKFAGKIDLIYIDPPFATGADFSMTAQVGESGEEIEKEQSAIEEKAYRDTWGRGTDSYVHMMYERLTLMKELLRETGTIYVHCDWRMNAFIRLAMNEVFGTDNFINEITWKRAHTVKGNIGQGSKYMGANTDTIFVYARSPSYIFNNIFVPYSEEYISTFFKYAEPRTGRKYRLTSMIGPGGVAKGNPTYAVMGVTRAWRYSESKMKDFIGKGLIVQTSPGTVPQKKQYLDEGLGVSIQSLWDDIPGIGASSNQGTNYPTQKPEALLERILKASSNEGDLVADFFCGSGTTLAVAEKTGRRWIGCDLGRWGVHVTRKRMLGIEKCKPFEVLNLGRYERQYWQGVTFGDAKGKPLAEQALYEYLAFILKLYGAQPVAGLTHLHGKKGKALVHIGAVDAPVTISEINTAVAECAKLKQGELHVLGWEWEMGLYDLMVEAAKKMGVKLLLLIIPREVMEQQAADKGDVRFFELAYLEAQIKQPKKLTAQVALKDFVIPNTELIPEEVRSKVKKWSDYIDYWAVDWDFRNDTFMQGWVAYRTRKDRTLPLTCDAHTYEKAGKYRILVKVIDIFGNDTSQAFDVEVK